jgi:hypothetical protein
LLAGGRILRIIDSVALEQCVFCFHVHGSESCKKTVATRYGVVGEFQRNSGRIVADCVSTRAMLTVPLTVAVHRIKKPFIYAGFDTLNTDGHR